MCLHMCLEEYQCLECACVSQFVYVCVYGCVYLGTCVCSCLFE